MINATFSDQMLPPTFKFKYCVESKMIGKFSGLRKPIRFANFTVYGEIRK